MNTPAAYPEDSLASSAPDPPPPDAPKEPKPPASMGEAMREAAARVWATAEEKRFAGDGLGYLTAAWATLLIQPDHRAAKRAMRRQRRVWEEERAGDGCFGDGFFDEVAWLRIEWNWLMNVWEARDFIDGLPAAHPAVLARLRRWEGLLAGWQRVTVSEPNNMEALTKCAMLLEQLGRDEEGLAVAERALTLIRRPSTNRAVVMNARGVLLETLGRHQEAARESEEMLRLLDSSELPEAATEKEAAWRLLFRCQALERLGRYEEALPLAERATCADPENDACLMAAGRCLVRLGHVGRGYARFYQQARSKGKYLGTSSVRWEGGPLAGKRLRVCSWEGMGDGIQYARYVPMLIRQGASVLLVCEDGAERLFRTLANNASENSSAGSPPANSLTVVPWSLHRHDHLTSVRHGSSAGHGGARPWNKGWDLDAALDDLPHFFDDVTHPDLIPAPGGYLCAAPADMERMRGLMAATETYPTAAPHGQARRQQENRSLRVGLVWRGGPAHSNDRNRSLPLSLLAPLAAVPGVRFFALQKGTPAVEAEEAPEGMRLVRLSPHLHDMADTAAAMALMDLVITVDSSPAHLAGSLGVPVWTLIAEPADWRWQVGREDTPWYASMRLFRQRTPGEWPEVIQRVAVALAGEVAGRVVPSRRFRA